MSKRILLVDDSKMFTDSMRQWISMKRKDHVVDAVNSGKDAIAILQSNAFDMVLLDINLGHNINGKDVATWIRKNRPDTKIIIVSAIEGDAMIMHLFRIGIDGYIRKSSSSEQLSSAIDQVLIGKKYFQEDIFQLIMSKSDMLSNLPAVDISPMENKMIQLIQEGKTHQEIADELKIPLRQAKYIREQLMTKTQTKNTAELVSYAHFNVVQPAGK